MPLSDYADRLEPDLLGALEQKGFSELTAVQEAVLDAALAGRDLRITSQTGSGKTVAIGLSLRSLTVAAEPAEKTGPRALVIAPTRELAHQVEQELRWLYAGRGTRLATTTGGSSYRDEHRALARSPVIVVGTPGRLLDHLTRGSIDASQVSAVVLDEADRMLDLGFREDLLAIFKAVPADRRTLLVSATFPRMVRALADRVQNNPVHVEGSPLGAANVDIDHVIHVVAPDQRLDALINLLLANPDDHTLVFVRMRADAAHVANELVMCGFAASALSGEMDQTSRNRTLAAFKQGGLRVLIATDVAARGIDAQNVTRVVHAELPTNPDAYTHRSGRTGRAGRKGTSSLLVAPVGVVRAIRLLRQLGVQHRVESIPTPEQIDRQTDTRLLAELTRASKAEPEADGGEAPAASAQHPLEHSEDLERWQPLARRLIEAGDLERSLARLLARTRASVTKARTVRVFAERPVGPDKARTRDRRDDRRGDREDRAPRAAPAARSEDARGRYRARDEHPARDRHAAPRARQHASDERPTDDEHTRREESAARDEHASSASNDGSQRYIPFRVSWGRQTGADARRMLAMVCRRGDIRGRDVGAIRIDSISTIVEVEASVAKDFERAATQRDPREPSVIIERQRGAPATREPAARSAAAAEVDNRGPRPAGPPPRKPHAKPQPGGDHPPRRKLKPKFKRR